MAIIQRKYKSGKTRYQVKVRDPYGRWYPSSVFDRKVDAQRYERSLSVRKDRGELAQSNLQGQMTFKDYWLKWAAECRGHVSEGWRNTQDQIFRDYLEEQIGNMKLRAIRSMDIGATLDAVRAKGRGAQVVMHVYNVLHKMFHDGVEHYELLDRNPVIRRYRPRIPKTERSFLSPKQSWKLLEVSRDTWIGPAVWISLLSGLRPSEVQALRWSSIDFDRAQILIRAAYNRKCKVLQDYPKQKDWGMAPMPEALSSYLEGLQAARFGNAFVAPGPGGGMLSYQTFLGKLRSLCKEAGVPRVTPHELRHSCTELYIEAGASAEDIRRLLNQKSLTATAKYIHRTDGRLSAIAGRVQCSPNVPHL